MNPWKKITAVTLLALFCVSACAAAVRPTKTTKQKRPKVRRIFWNPVLRGSHESMLRQNEEIDRLQLPRIEDDYQLEDLKSRLELVEIPDSPGMRVDPRLEPARRYCRSWTLGFLQDLGVAYYRQFRSSLQLNSAVRTMEQQKVLRRRNRNAAPEWGEAASSHLAGITVDLSKRGLSRKQRKWLDNFLVDLRDQGLIEAAEERRQAVYHIMVSERYIAWREIKVGTPAPTATDTDTMATSSPTSVPE